MKLANDRPPLSDPADTTEPAMTRRREFLILAAAAGVALMLPGGVSRALAQAAGDRSSTFLRGVTDKLVTVVNGPGTEAEKKRGMQQIIEQNVDVDGVAQFCLGRHWRDATPEQRAQYVALFHDVLVNSITGHLGEYTGVKVVVGRTQQHEDTDTVSSSVERPNNAPANVDWIISNAGPSPKIVDVVAEGTSLRLTQRSDYAAYLSHNGNNLQALIDAMKHQAQRG
jgi:phospholipid transport system substrate-binding protein